MKRLVVIGLSLDLVGTFCLAKGLLLSSTDITKVAGTYWEYNPYFKAGMIADRNWAIAGLCLIGFGFLLQLISAWKEK